MQPLKLGAMICNISVSVGEKVTYLADSYGVPHLPTPHTPPSSNTLITTLKTRPEKTVILHESV